MVVIPYIVARGKHVTEKYVDVLINFAWLIYW